jgi:hypothetical protein
MGTGHDLHAVRRRRLQALGIAAATATTLAATSAATASLVIDVRITGASGSGNSISSKSAFLGAVGSTVTMGVYARISGTNSSQIIGDLDGNGDANDTTNDDSLNIVTGSFTSTGTLTGNLSANAPGQGVSYNTRVAPFSGPGSQNGIATDWDTDGDLDIGAVGTDPTNMFVARSAATTFAALENGNTKSYFSGSFTANTDETIIDATTSEVRIGTLRFVVASSGGTANVNFLQRPTTDAGSALWFEDGIVTGKTPGSGTYQVGAPVFVTVGPFPEPASASLIGIVGLDLLARRRDRRNHQPKTY